MDRRYPMSLLVALAACGGRVDEASDSGSNVDASVAPDASLARDAAMDAAMDAALDVEARPDATEAGDASIPGRYATIYGETLVAGGASLATAEFSSVDGTPLVCTLSIPPGSCAVALCGYAAADPSENAGTIVVADGALAATLTYAPGPPATYDTWQGSTVGWAAPSTFTFSAPASDALPEGLMQALPFPASTTLLSPDFETTGTLQTGAPLALSWSPAVTTEVVFVLEATPPADTAHYAFLACLLDGSAGAGEIAASYLADFKSLAAGSTDARAGFLTVVRTLDVEQGWSIELAAFGPGGAYGPVTLD